jgi:hypothetical protein
VPTGERRELLLVLAKQADEKAKGAKDAFVKEAWTKVAEAYRHLASLC